MWRDVFSCLYAGVLIGSRNHALQQRGQPLSHPNLRHEFAYTCLSFDWTLLYLADHFAVAQVPSGFHEQNEHEGSIPGPA
jgi:hypothetical protein